MLQPKPFYADTTERALTTFQSDQAAMGRSLTLEPWKQLGLTSPWMHGGGGLTVPAEYTKDRFGFVHIRGIISSSANVSAGVSVVTLPVGYRSALHAGFALPVGSSGGVNSVANAGFNASGVFQLNAIIGAAIAFPFTVNYLWLSGIHYYAEG